MIEYKKCTIQGFENLYLIYSNGDIYSLRKHRLLKPYPNGMYNYQYVTLTGHTKGVYLRTGIHRIVAMHWLDKQPDTHIALGKYEINHIDGDTTNNDYTNLEWVSRSENMRKAYERRGKWMKGRKPGFKASKSAKQKMSEKKKKLVLLFNDNERLMFDSIQDTADYLGVHRRSIERRKNRYTTIKGFNVRYLTD